MSEKIRKRLMQLLYKLEHHPHPTIDLGLERMQHFLQLIDNPQKHLSPVIHVAGTNGKGSVLAFITAILQAEDLRVHRTTSPHLVRFNERFMVANEQVSDEMLVSGLELLLEQQASCPLTYFESAIALAFSLFAANPADATLLEVGLGGRLDATNVIDAPLATVIMPIGLDHQAYLGNTLGNIAYEKAAIMKPGSPCIVSGQEPEALTVIEEVAESHDIALWRKGKEWESSIDTDGKLHYASDTFSITTPAPSLPGFHQYDNAAVAIAVMDRVGAQWNITPAAIAHGIAHAQWQGRLQPLPDASVQKCFNTHHTIFVDGGHNPHAAQALAQWIKAQTRPVHIICGMRQDKDAREVLHILAEHASTIGVIAIPDEPQAMSAQALYELARLMHSHVYQADSLHEAVTYITMTDAANACILITGSLYLVGATLALIENEMKKPM